MILTWKIAEMSGRVVDVDESTMNRIIATIEGNEAVLELNFENSSLCLDKLQLFADRFLYVLLYAKYTDDEYIVHTYCSDIESNEHIELCGEVWSANVICSDISIVRVCFSEFFNKGSINSNLLN